MTDSTCTKVIRVLVSAVCSLLFIGAFWFYHQAHYPTISLPQDLVGMDVHQFESVSSPVKPALNMELVTVFHLDYPGASDEILHKREKEYMRALQTNLNHDHVKRIHILSTDAKKLKMLLKTYLLSNQSKVLIAEQKSVNLTRDIYDYISENLVGVDVMFLNSDIYLGAGFDRVDPVVLRKNKIMYALTRQVNKEEEKCEVDKCRESTYLGSHDTFLFHLTERIPDSALQHLNFKFPQWGVENVVMWMFQSKLGYCLLNPCTILETFHLHCTNLRNRNRKRVNNKKNTGLAPFTESLVCH